MKLELELKKILGLKAGAGTGHLKNARSGTGASYFNRKYLTLRLLWANSNMFLNFVL